MIRHLAVTTTTCQSDSDGPIGGDTTTKTKELKDATTKTTTTTAITHELIITHPAVPPTHHHWSGSVTSCIIVVTRNDGAHCGVRTYGVSLKAPSCCQTQSGGRAGTNKSSRARLRAHYQSRFFLQIMCDGFNQRGKKLDAKYKRSSLYHCIVSCQSY
jgi:hypothetical protein